MDGVEADSVWDTSVAALETVPNATVTVTADHDTYRAGDYMDLHISSGSVPAIDPAFTTMEYTLNMESQAVGIAHNANVVTTAAQFDIRFGHEFVEDPAVAITTRCADNNRFASDFSLLSNLAVPNVMGGLGAFREVVSRTDAGVVIDEIQRYDLVNKMKHMYAKTPASKGNDSLFTGGTVDENEFGLVKKHRLYQPRCIGHIESAVFKGLLSEKDGASALSIGRAPVIEDAISSGSYWATLKQGANAQQVCLRYALGAPPADIARYFVPGNVMEVWRVALNPDGPPVAGTNAAVKQFVGYVGIGTESGIIGAANSVGLITDMKSIETSTTVPTETFVNVFGPFYDGVDRDIAVANRSNDGRLTFDSANADDYYYALRPVTGVTYNTSLPVIHEIPSPMFQYPQTHVIYTSYLGGLRMRWKLAGVDEFFQRFETTAGNLATTTQSYSLSDVKFRIRSITPSVDMALAMQEAVESADGTFFDLMTYAHNAQTIPAGVSDYTVNLSAFTQRRAFSMFAILEQGNGVFRSHSAKFTDNVLREFDAANPLDRGYRQALYSADLGGVKAYQWQLWGRQQPSHEVEVDDLSRNPTGMMSTSTINAQEIAKALSNIGLTVEDLRNQTAMLLIPRRLSAMGGFADLAGEQPCNPMLRLKFTNPTSRPMILHVFCAHQARVTVSSSAGVLVAE